MNKALEINTQPLIAIWELNRNGDDRSCQGIAPGEALDLTAKESEKLIRDIADLKPPVFAFAGANPLKHDQIFSLVAYAASCGLHPRMHLTAGPALTREAIAALKSAGLSRLELTLEASTQVEHDSITGVQHSFLNTVRAMQWANEMRLPIQIRTTISRTNMDDLDGMVFLLKRFKILGWSLSFPVSSWRTNPADSLSAEDFEQTFERIYELAQQVPFKIKTTEAEHYRRFILQQRTKARAGHHGVSYFAEEGIPGILPVSESRASLFISSTGEIFPSGCLPVSAGNVRRENLTDVYRHSELFTTLRDPANLKGKCGQCEFKQLCGGSRARAFWATGDMFGQDDSCSYQPAA